MRIYSVHERAGRPVDGAGVVFVREGFSWAALFLTVFWLGYRRLWLALVLYVAASAGIAFLGEALGLSGEARLVLAIALQILLAAEANDIRRWTLARRGYREIGLASGGNIDEAERDFFRRWEGPVPASAQSPSAPGTVSPRGGAVWPRHKAADDHGPIGLFPRAGG
jgi:hypothetical protein